MTHVVRDTVAVTTIADGSATEYSARLNGFLDSIQYVKTDFADGVDFTITEEDTGRTLWAQSNVNASAVSVPRQPTNDTVGVASLYAAGGEPVEARIPIAGRVKIVIASGGDTKAGTFHINIV